MLKICRVGTIVAEEIIEGRTYGGQEYTPTGGHDRKAPFSSTCIEEMGTPSRQQLGLAHDDSLAKGD